MAAVGRNQQKEEQLNDDSDDSNSFTQRSEDLEEDGEKEEANLGRALELKGCATLNEGKRKKKHGCLSGRMNM